MILDVQNISKSFGETRLFDSVAFHIEEHEKVALVGVNGAGKSTLLKILLDRMEADSGQVVISKDVSIGYLSQQPEISSDLSVMDELLKVKADLMALEEDIRRSEHLMKSLSDEALDEELARYARLTERFEREGGYRLKSEAVGVLKGLGFSEEDFPRKSSVLSGGQKTRLEMGRLLLASPDILFLDEPTNHLDLGSIIWLETYLQNYKGAVLVVSHDRYFLNKIVTKVIELDNGKSYVYAGTFDDYTKKKEDRLRAAYAAYLKAERERQHQEAVITKLQQFNREKSIKRAESRKKVLDKMKTVNKPTTDATDMRLHLKPRFESGHDVLRVENLTKAFGDNQLLEDASFELFKGERLLLIGPNGSGKSTLLKMLNGIQLQNEGSVIFGTKVVIGYYDQEMQELSPEKTIFQEIADAYPTLNNTTIRTALAAFLFTGEEVFKQISLLSGGERARVSLAKLMLSEANFLILDEPTNHLDIQSKEILENALNAYEGTVLSVSHDRYFINRVATRILELDNKKLVSYPGNYDDFLFTKEKLAAATLERQEAALQNGDTKVTAMETEAKTSWKDQKALDAKKRKIASDLKKTEEKIACLEEELDAINTKLSDPTVACDPAESLKLSRRHAEAEAELEELYELWESISEEAQTIQ